MKKLTVPSPMARMSPGPMAAAKVGDSDSVAVISDALSNIEPKPEAWLSKDFFKVENPRHRAVVFSGDDHPGR